jgi:hypothetical protein
MTFYRREVALTIFKIYFIRSINSFYRRYSQLVLKYWYYFHNTKMFYYVQQRLTVIITVFCLYLSPLPILNELAYFRKIVYEHHVTL